MKITLRHILFYVPSMEHAIAHYRLTFGCEPSVERPGWAEFEKDGLRIALHKGKGGSARFEYHTPDLEAVRNHWIEAGQSPTEITEQRGIRAFQGYGPGGNTYLVKEVPPEG